MGFRRHVGDLGNIEAGPDGIARVNFQDSVIQLLGAHSNL
ncbi:MAG: superoxide dismutase family protein [Gammaproteobacteria bacterium]|nr:superoxide dismutase family protein [Gammaproteobacteria bacterium]